MNDLSNKFMTFLSGMSDYQTNMTEDMEKSNVNPLNKKIFYLFQADSDGKNKGKKNKDKRNKLASSQERSEKGIPQEGEIKRKKTNLGKGTNNELELVMHDLPVPEHLRKDQ